MLAGGVLIDEGDVMRGRSYSRGEERHKAGRRTPGRTWLAVWTLLGTHHREPATGVH
jgi:hypothetical protein